MLTKPEVLVLCIFIPFFFYYLVQFSSAFMKFSDEWKKSSENSQKWGATGFDLFSAGLSDEGKVYRTKVIKSAVSGILVLVITFAAAVGFILVNSVLGI